MTEYPTDYVPDDAEVQVSFSMGLYDGVNRVEGQRAFRRWLVLHDAKVHAAALAEGAKSIRFMRHAHMKARTLEWWNGMNDAERIFLATPAPQGAPKTGDDSG